MRTFKIIFIPYSKKGNPYQKLLRENLQKLGVEVEGAGFYRIFPILIATLHHWKPDIAHIHWHHPFLVGSSHLNTVVKSVIFILELLILKVYGIKIVWTVHNIVDHERKFVSIQLIFSKLLARLCNGLIVHCPSAKREVVKVFRVNDSLIVVIPHGRYTYTNTISKIQARQRLKIGPDIVFLYFGTIRPYKGIPKLIDAFKKLNHKRAKLLIAGNPFDEGFAKELQNRCRENENIRTIFEFIPDDELQVYMNAADVVVLPYIDILTSGAVILAMSFGKPVIAPTIGCMPDILDTKGSLLYNPAEKDALVKAMRKAMDADLENMGKHNFKLAEMLQWDEVAKRTYEVYAGCLKRER